LWLEEEIHLKKPSRTVFSYFFGVHIKALNGKVCEAVLRNGEIGGLDVWSVSIHVVRGNHRKTKGGNGIDLNKQRRDRDGTGSLRMVTDYRV